MKRSFGIFEVFVWLRFQELTFQAYMLLEELFGSTSDSALLRLDQFSSHIDFACALSLESWNIAMRSNTCQLGLMNYQEAYMPSLNYQPY